jgi:mono/diheme cytochrome c family protein
LTEVAASTKDCVSPQSSPTDQGEIREGEQVAQTFPHAAWNAIRLRIKTIAQLARSATAVAAILITANVLPIARADASGASLFIAHCAVCHQSDGQGIPGMYPPLADSVGDFVHSPDGRAYLVHVLSFGLNGPIVVSGAHYNGYMQSWAQLSDDDIAQLLNHVLTDFNAKQLPRDFAPFTPTEVKRERSRTMTSSDVYHELQSLGTADVKAEMSK